MTQREADSGPSGRFIHSFTHSLNDVYWPLGGARHCPGTSTSEDESATDPYPSSVNTLTEGDGTQVRQHRKKSVCSEEMPGGEYHAGGGGQRRLYWEVTQEQRPEGTKEPDKGLRREQCSCRWDSQCKNPTASQGPPVARGTLRASHCLE